ncbi:MAG TPA: lipoate--protein ligase [Bacteroidales bacterium]|nr:lipoate--protein ligase [Bacteroidales bacterium]HRZ47828.1 lipoate--protein ligase [Bacteroidales bacterium]
MLCIFDYHTDPAFNLAAEEYVLKNFTDEVFMLWRNDNAIIVGKHQNTLAEINLDYVKEKHIKVIRRLSGGGAVFHDLGNINFTFIMNGEGEKLIDFHKYTLPILEVMQKLGIPAKFEGRNDLTIDGKKFSGNAEHVYRNRVLHHGTLLFSAVMQNLTAALNARPEKFDDKGVKSVRSRVTNISEHLKEPMDVMEFAQRVMDHIREMYPDAIAYAYTPQDIEAIENLKKEKYDTWEWNFGYSPVYNFSHFHKTEGGFIEVAMQVDKGIIAAVKFSGDFFNKSDVSEFEQMLTGRKHDQEQIRELVKNVKIDDYFVKATPDDLMEVLF